MYHLIESGRNSSSLWMESPSQQNTVVLLVLTEDLSVHLVILMHFNVMVLLEFSCTVVNHHGIVDESKMKGL